MSPSSILFIVIIAANVAILGVCGWLVVKLLRSRNVLVLMDELNGDLGRENARLLRELAERG